ncbi:tetratricopeptide repeat-containing sulfotransferase family protein [Hyphomonas jannaschiana]|uniref:Sulfotransferase n=1 Tax=Hyphomonas jannaschiana VP2 TaxID=1280952 RepID=A0A059FGZ1_9PROT|nr:tetratricopeptide repeat-containing sulfotransferase family protein [Hyphomonas jannaschiana]KCZ89877.1 sulfotransferase [Hyphomonas jannaschiana VP2]
MTDLAAPENALQQAQKAIQAGDFQAASKITGDILATQPQNRDALYMAAVCARYQNRHDDAFARLAELKAASPDYGRAWQEEGHLRRKLGDNAGALTAFERATRYNPSLIASWNAQADLHTAAGNPVAASSAQAQAQRLQTLPRELLAVTNHIHEGRIFRAEEIARAFLQRNPTHVEGMRLLADIGSRLGVQEDADFLLESAVELAPDNIQLRLDYIQVLRKRQKFAAALEQAQILMDRDPDNPVFQSHYAIESMQAGDYETALDYFERVLSVLPDDPATLVSRGHALKTYGRTDDAITSYRRAAEVAPGHGDAWYGLANLKTYRFSDAELTAMEAAAASPDLDHASRIHIAFALGKAREDRKDYDKAFAAYASGNALKHQTVRYTTEQMQAELSAQKTHCTRDLFEKQSGKGCPAPDPIFIVGLPRAGSTLIEQILASHPQVDGTLELPNILSLAHRLRGRSQITDRDRYPRILHEMSAEDLCALGEDYIENTRIHRQGAPFFTDKMPNNFRHIGLIHLILPNAKIIDARRNPMDCCWSGFKQLFAEGQEFTYSLDDIGHYYRAYVDMMAYWESVLPPGRILRVQHEDVLDDLESQVRKLLDYCGLPFDERCVNFHQTERAVRTASSEQVRRPINKAGLEQWRPYEAHLGPLKSALGPGLAPS